MSINIQYMYFYVVIASIVFARPNFPYNEDAIYTTFMTTTLTGYETNTYFYYFLLYWSTYNI